MSEDKDFLIIKALEAKATGEELAELRQWAAESNENRRRLEQLRKLWNITHRYTPTGADKEQALTAFLQHIHNERPTSAVTSYANEATTPHVATNRRLRPWLWAAASVALIVGLFAGQHYLREDEPEQPLAETNVKADHPTAKAELRLASGTTVSLGTEPSAIADQYLSGVTTTTAGTLDYSQAEAAVDVKNTVSIPRGGFYRIVLSDGTDVVLNSASELIFPAKFLGHMRHVYLKGEAYFDVVHDATHPFVVSTELGADIKVLGTRFNVSTYNNKVRATLVEGSICLNAGETGLTVTLQPGQMAEYAANAHQLTTTDVDPYLYTAWKDGKFVFENETIEDIMGRLAVWYNIDFKFADDSIRHETFTGVLSRFSDPNDILRLIEATTAVQFSIKGSTVIVRGDGGLRE